MNYQEARAYIEEITGRRGSVLGLEAMTELAHRLGDPQDRLKFIHVSGTNGKGSIVAYVSTVLSEAGLRTGRYISPTLFSYRERIQIDGENISREDFARIMTRIAETAAVMEQEGVPVPTAFEQETAAAFLYFLEKNCDLVVLETGLGGSTDATNIVKTTVLSIIGAIGMDHMAVLGNTLAEIAEKKAGIIKPGIPVVSAWQEPEAMGVIEEACRRNRSLLTYEDPQKLRVLEYGAETQRFHYGPWADVIIHLAGSYQIRNACIALEALAQLRDMGYLPDAGTVHSGMAKTCWKGRFTVLHRDPLLIVDGAHNPHAAAELRRSLELYFPDQKLYFILGVFSDKDYPEVIRLTAPLAGRIFTVRTPGNPRALPAEQLRDAVAEVNPSVEACESIREAVCRALQIAEKDDVILAFGSLSYLAEVEKALLS